MKNDVNKGKWKEFSGLYNLSDNDFKQEIFGYLGNRATSLVEPTSLSTTLYIKKSLYSKTKNFDFGSSGNLIHYLYMSLVYIYKSLKIN